MPFTLAEVSSPPILSAGGLRSELNQQALAFAVARELRYELAPGRSTSVIFGEDEQGHHGNFHPASYQAILAEPGSVRRLRKAHTASRRAMPRADWRWRELDCAVSSDALLMNIFCYPDLFRDGRLAALLGVSRTVRTYFGVKPRTPLVSGLQDATEIDLVLSDEPGADPQPTLLLEAKLTETDFQTASSGLVERYRDFATVFDAARLPRTRLQSVAEEWNEAQSEMTRVVRGREGRYCSYQLIRGTLAAHATGAAFCVLADQRRHDLAEHWLQIICAVRSAGLRCRLKLLTWQELASALPPALQDFLSAKYGIHPAP